MSKDTAKAYQFKIVNGAITAVYEVKNGRVKLEKMEQDEAWSISGANIVKTESEHGRIETTVYSDPDGDGMYAKVAKSTSDDAVVAPASVLASSNGVIAVAQKAYQFDVVNGNVTAVYEIERGYKSLERIEANESWTVDGGTIVKTETSHGINEKTVYADINGDGVFVKVSSSYIAADGSLLLNQTGGDDDESLGQNPDAHVLQGTVAKDVFKISSESGSHHSDVEQYRIAGFTAGDKIDLSAIDARIGNGGNDAFIFIGDGATLSSANANGAVWFKSGMLYVSNDLDMAAEFQIALVGVTSLDPADIVL